MNKYIATVIRTGNSYALRVPKKYFDDAQLELGRKVSLALPLTSTKQDRRRIQDILARLQETKAYHEIKDPVAWQRSIRQDRPLPGRDT